MWVVFLVIVGAGALAGLGASLLIVREDARREQAGHDPAARADLLELAQRSARATWWVEGRFVRRFVDGRTLSSDAFALNRPPDYLSGAAGSVSGVVGGAVVQCTTTAEGEESIVCTPAQSVPTTAGDAPAIQVVTAEVLDDYAVVRLPDDRIAGETARCFELQRVSRARLLELGDRAELCFSEAGVPLRRRTVRTEAVDDLTTTSVRRRVTDDDFAALTGAPPPPESEPATSVPSTS